MASNTVLIIEDDVEFLKQMAVAFAAGGYSVQIAPDGKVGLARFLASPTALVITDIIMPNREGIETIVALKSASPRVKIIAISGGYRVGPADFLELAGHLGADGVLAKPFRISALMSLAAEVLAPDYVPSSQ